MQAGWVYSGDFHPAWIYGDGSMWVRHYPATAARGEHWQAYRIVGKRHTSREPWGNNNERMGGDSGYPSLIAAMRAVELNGET